MIVQLVVTMVLFTILIIIAVTTHAVPTKSYDRDWWKHAVFYQIYVKSFKDGDNNGVGDLNGIIQKVDHFPDAGITAIILSPIFKSPQRNDDDDISDYRLVDPVYGTNDDLIELVNKAHNLGIKVVLDFVPNHTSDQHEWFIRSENEEEPYRDYYVWVDGKINEEGKRIPPNNWISVYKNSTWTWSEKRQQYFLHQFLSSQPDLNYRNEKVIDEIKNVFKFWMDHDIDGFRIKAIPFLVENADFLDEPLSGQSDNKDDYNYLLHIYTFDQPSTFDILYNWRDFVDAYSNETGGAQRILIGEAYTNMENTMQYYGNLNGSRLGAHFALNFNLITDVNNNSFAQDFVNAITKWLDAMPTHYVPNWMLGNSDHHRAATRFGRENIDGFNMLVALLPGIIVSYNGEEIGQENGEVTFEQGQDPIATNPDTFSQISRDFERTPFQWDNSSNAGFNDGAETWLPVSREYLKTNLWMEEEFGRISHFKIYQKLMKFRQLPVCNRLRNNVIMINAISDKVLLLKRQSENIALVVIFNIGEQVARVNVEDVLSKHNIVHLASVNSTKYMTTIDPSHVILDPHESIMVFDIL